MEDAKADDRDESKHELPAEVGVEHGEHQAEVEQRCEQPIKDDLESAGDAVACTLGSITPDRKTGECKKSPCDELPTIPGKAETAYPHDEESRHAQKASPMCGDGCTCLAGCGVRGVWVKGDQPRSQTPSVF